MAYFNSYGKYGQAVTRSLATLVFIAFVSLPIIYFVRQSESPAGHDEAVVPTGLTLTDSVSAADATEEVATVAAGDTIPNTGVNHLLMVMVFMVITAVGYTVDLQRTRSS